MCSSSKEILVRCVLGTCPLTFQLSTAVKSQIEMEIFCKFERNPCSTEILIRKKSSFERKSESDSRHFPAHLPTVNCGQKSERSVLIRRGRGSPIQKLERSDVIGTERESPVMWTSKIAHSAFEEEK